MYMICMAEKTKPFNVKLDPDLTDWVNQIKLGNASMVVRAGVWLLSLQSDADEVINGRNMIIIPHAKGHKSRLIPLAPCLARQLRKVRQKTGPIFPAASGRHYAETQWRDRLRPLQAAIPAFTHNHRGTGTAWHLLRHTFGYRMASRGCPLPVLKEIMGHTRIQTTMIYARLSPDVWYDDIKKA